MKRHFQQQFTDQSNIEYWDSIYDQQDFSGDCYRQRMSIVLSWIECLSLYKNSKILDVGCGAGRFTQEAAKRGYKVFGMDYSHGMMVKTSNISNREDELNTSFLQGDIESLPLKDSSFDVIVCLGVVAYLKSEEKALHEFERILKPNGVLAISIVNKACLASRLDMPVLFIKMIRRILDGITAPWKRGADNTDTGSLTTYLIPKFRNSLELAGFTVLDNQTVPWKLLTFFGKEILPQKLAKKITLFFEQFSNIPIVDSFGGMCIFKAEKNSCEINGGRSSNPNDSKHS
jgi:ubiquinone/menaquinone biosynthesis C-methylase UbiE